MLGPMVEFLLNPPARLKALGQFLSGGSGVLIILALYLRSGVLAVEIVQSMAKAKVTDVTLASMYPGFPTWFIPEGISGFVFWVLIWFFGVYAVWFAKQVESV